MLARGNGREAQIAEFSIGQLASVPGCKVADEVGLNRGRIDAVRLRRVLASVELRRAADGRLVLAVDVSPWLRPDAATSDARSFCHTYGRGENKHLMIPGWPVSWIVALETGRSSWTAPLDAVRLRPGDDLAAVTARQIRDLVRRLVAEGQWRPGDPLAWIVLAAGYDVMRLAWLLDDLPVELIGRLRPEAIRFPNVIHWFGLVGLGLRSAAGEMGWLFRSCCLWRCEPLRVWQPARGRLRPALGRRRG
ncbi:hypothetical protein GZL_09389 [Streptomyces sp. 769]|nr:hypothetical protein GZL_00024 [Streptomyces sp. 769]AJC61907.1 hypothetical protein GZL_09389 [Streptomyces sp. 769]